MSVAVPVACPCPGTPHEDGDTVDLRDRLGLAAGTAVQHLVIEANKGRPADALADTAAITGLLSEAYLLHGVESWSFLDADGKPLPVNADTIRSVLLSDFALAYPVAEAADDLYMAAVILPLVPKAKTLSPPTPTRKSTSRPRSITQARRKQSKRYSTSTIQTDDTGTISA
jgi:hypothetical protein